MLLFSFTVEAQTHSNCSCAHYYPTQAQTPDWIGIDKVTDTLYISSGSSQCSGLKSIDERRSALEARKALTKLLKTEIEIKEENQLFSSNSISNLQFNSTAKITSDQLLKNAKIFERWVDKNNCVVYAGVTINHTDIQKAQAQKKQEAQSKLSAKNNCIKSTGSQAGEVKSLLTAKFIQNGFNITDSACDVYYHVKNSIVKSSQNKVFTRLQLEIITHTNKRLWQDHYQGKGISFSKRSTEQLLQIANEDSISLLIEDIIKLKDTPVN